MAEVPQRIITLDQKKYNLPALIKRITSARKTKKPRYMAALLDSPAFLDFCESAVKYIWFFS
jgi:hypothetical protein